MKKMGASLGWRRYYIYILVLIFSFLLVTKAFAVLPSDSLDAFYDVIIIGAGSGGTSAAIQAARMGAKVALLEESDWIGGQMTAAGVPNMDEGAGSTGQTDVLRKMGIYNEFIDKIRQSYGTRPVGTCYWSSGTIAFEPKVGQEALYEMIEETRNDGKTLHLSLNTQVLSVIKQGNTVTGVTVEVADTTKTVNCKVLIDATEYGDLLGLAGADYRIGNSSSQRPNPNALIQRITHTAVIKKYTNGVPSNLKINDEPNGYYDAKQLFLQVIKKDSNNIQKVGGGNYPYDFPSHNGYRGLPDSDNEFYTGNQLSAITKTVANWANDYPGNTYVPGTPELRAQYLLDKSYRKQINDGAKLQTLKFLYYIQDPAGLNQPNWSISDVEGFNNQEKTFETQYRDIEKHFPPIPYVRESARMVGLYRLSGADIYREGSPLHARKRFPHAIAVGYYFTDLHGAEEDSDYEIDLGETEADNSSYGPFQIPLECLIPEKVDGFLAAEKNISMTRLANGASRLQPITMLTGQAAGAIAALAAADSNKQPREIRAVSVQKVLLENQYPTQLTLFEFNDVPWGHSLWKYVQLAKLYKILNGYSDTSFGVDEQLLRRHAAAILCKYLNLPTDTPPDDPTFLDVPTNHPNYAQIEALVEAGITNGTGDGKFSPDASLSRAAFAVMLSKGLELEEDQAPPLEYYEDVNTGDWYFKHIQLLTEKGVLDALNIWEGKKYFFPNTTINRGETAKFLMKHFLIEGEELGYASAGDTTLPSTPVVTAQGNPPSASWLANDFQSGIIEYEYKIIDDDFNVIKDWAPIGITNIVSPGISIPDGKTYYFAVKCCNGAGMWSDIGYSSGVTSQSTTTNYFRIQNKKSPTNKWLHSESDDSVDMAPTSWQGDWTRWSKNVVGNGYFYIINKNSGKKLKAVSPIGTSLTGEVTVASAAATDDSVKWTEVDAGSGYVRFENKGTNQWLHYDNLDPDQKNADMAPNTWTGDYTRWKWEDAN